MKRPNQQVSPIGLSFSFSVVITLFFYWGFVNANNNPLVSISRAVFDLSYTQALLIQIVFFAASGIAALPAAAVEQQIGTVRVIVGSLGLMGAGALLIVASLPFALFPALLAALFILACGNTALQVAANPLAAAMGSSKTAHSRLNFAQGFNSIGVVLGVHFGSHVMLEGASNAQHGASALEGVATTYVFIAVLASLAALLVWAQRRTIKAFSAPPQAMSLQEIITAATHSPALIAGGVAIALYVGAEVAIGSLMIDFLNGPDILSLPLAEGGWYLANIYWGGALIGRFIGSALLLRYPAKYLLALFAVCASGLCLIVISGSGLTAGIAALAIGLFNSIMFPTIFSLTFDRAEMPGPVVSGFLCLSISAGALIPLMIGVLADVSSLSFSFIVPAAAYFLISVFALGRFKR